jgi:hypothetical protein
MMMPAYTSQSSSDGELPLDVEKQGTTHNGGRNLSAGEKEKDLLKSELKREGEDDERWEPEFLDTNATCAAGALGRVLSRISTKASWNPGPPPNGGKKAWLMCKYRCSLYTYSAPHTPRLRTARAE